MIQGLYLFRIIDRPDIQTYLLVLTILDQFVVNKVNARMAVLNTTGSRQGPYVLH
jgi:hypothetical protein